MWGRKRESTRLELGSDHLPVGMIAASVLILAFVVFLVAYFNRTPYGAAVTPPREAEIAFKEYLAKNEPRVPGDYTFYNCAGFFDSIFSGDQRLGAAFELRGLRAIAGPIAEPDVNGNVILLAGQKKADGDWRIVSSRPPGIKYPLMAGDAVNAEHPCSLDGQLEP